MLSDSGASTSAGGYAMSLPDSSQGTMQNSGKRGGKCSCFGGPSKMLTEGAGGTSPQGMQYAMSTQDQYSQGSMQNSAKRGGKCSCFDGPSKMLTEGAGGTSAQGTQYAMSTQDQYSQGCMQNSAKSKGKCCCFGGPSKMLTGSMAGPSARGMQSAMSTQDQYSQGHMQNSAKRGGKCSCFGGPSKMIGGASGTSAQGAQYAMSTQDQYSQSYAQTSAKRGGKCACFGGTSKMVGASTVDSRQTQVYGQSQEGATMYSDAGVAATGKATGACSCCFGVASKMSSRRNQEMPLASAGSAQDVQTGSKSRGKCPCFGGPAKMLGAVPVTPAADMVQPVQGSVATYETSQPYETQQVASGAVLTDPMISAPTTQVSYEAPQPQGDVLIATQELYAPLEVTPISLGDESQPITQTVPTTYAAAPPSAIVSMPQTLVMGQHLPVAATPAATYSAKPTTANFIAQGPARAQYSTRQVINPSVVSHGLISPVPTATLQSPYAQQTTSPVTYTSTAPAQLSPMSMQGLTYPAGTVTSMPYRESTGQPGVPLTGSMRTRPGQIIRDPIREPAVGGAPIYLPGSSAVVSAGGTPTSSTYVAASTSPLTTKSPSPFMSQQAISGQGASIMSQQPMTNQAYLNQSMSLTRTAPSVMRQTYDGSSASRLSRALRTVQGPIQNTRAFQKEISRSTESMQ